MKKLFLLAIALVMLFAHTIPAIAAAPAAVNGNGATVSAIVDKFTGNQNRLLITITGDDGDIISQQSFIINNNAAGTYTLGDYKVYVDTKGNTQVRTCYFVAIPAVYYFIDFYADTSDIILGEEKSVTFTSITDPSDAISKVDVINANGSVVASLFDNGLNGDDVAGDHVFKGTATLVSLAEGNVSYFATALNHNKSEFSISFYQPITEPEITQFMEATNALQTYRIAIVTSMTEYENVLDRVEVYIKSLVSTGIVSEYKRTSKLIVIHYTSGITEMFTPNTEGILGANSVLSSQPNRLEQYTDAPDKVAQDLQNSEYQYFWADMDDTHVSVDLMKNLDNYKVIVTEGHGAYQSFGDYKQTVMSTGETVTADKTALYMEDLLAKRIVNMNGKYQVTAEFFKKYYRSGDFPNSIIFFGSCELAGIDGSPNSTIADVLISKGAGAVFAYRNAVSTIYNENMCETVFSELMNQKTTKQALQTAKNKHGSVEPWPWLYFKQDPAELILFGNQNLKLPYSPTSQTTKIAAGAGHTVILKENGTIWSWGHNYFGQFGNETIDTNSPYANPTPVKANITGAVSIATGGHNTFAIMSDGTVQAWGYNETGQLGDGTTINRLTPVQVKNISGIVQVSASQSLGHAIAVKNDGSVWTWGYNYGTKTANPNPFKVDGLSGIIQVAAGNDYSVAVRNDGTVWTWGYNSYGQLGDGTTIDRLVPAQVNGISQVIQVAACSRSTIALKSDGTIWSWGYNAAGELGDGSTVDRKTPVQANITGVVKVVAGGDSVYFIKNDGTVWACGYNANGQLGNNTKNSASTPVRVSNLSNVTQIAAGSDFAVALNSDGVWAWGYNGYSQIGDGTRIDRYVPTKCNLQP